MEQKSRLNKYKGTIISIIVHLIFLFLLLRSFKDEIFIDPNSFRPTSTIGYQVELVHTDISQPKPQSEQTPSTPEQTIADNLQPKQADIKLKSTPKNVEKQPKKQPIKPPKPKKAQIVETEKVKALKDKTQKKEVNTTADRNQDGVVMTNKNQANIVASSPKPMNSTQVGDGGDVNSSTNGTGNQSGKFDFRVIQYGRDAADAIKQNIVVPPKLANQYFTYRAFIRLSPNMQYESMVLVKSTGNLDMDRSIAKALRQTVYPPLPPGADFEQYKNIDFTIK